jgi:uncharacterized protein (DUF58 family)
MNRASIPEAELRRFAHLAAPLLQGTAAGGFGPRAARNRPGRGLEFLDTRHYEPGDDIRTIDWRQSARNQQLIIRRYRDETAADWFICVDCSASVEWGGHKWPATARLATALAYTLLYAGHRVAVMLFSDRINGLCKLGRGAHHYAALLKTLSVENYGGASNLGLCSPLLTQNSNVFILSDFLEPDGMRPELKSIRARAATVNAIQILDEDELQIPTRAVTELRDVESGEIRHVAMSDEAAQVAADKLHLHCETLRNDCNGMGVRFTTCQTEPHWQRVLLDHLTPSRQ